MFCLMPYPLYTQTITDISFAYLTSKKSRTGIFAKEPWFAISIEDSDEAHFSISRDPFARKERVLTLSLPVINGNDGANSGVLALNLDLDKIADSQNACKAFNAT